MNKRNIIIISCIIIFVISFTIYVFIFSKDEDKYAKFEHFDINEYEHITLTIDNDENKTYGVAHLSTDGENFDTDGLFYRVSYNDYILLDKIDAGTTGLGSHSNYLYKDTINNQDKLYVHRSLWPLVTEYVLDGENTKRKDLNFDVTKITKAETSMLTIFEIKEIIDNNIYLKVDIIGYNKEGGEIKTVADMRNLNIKCSLIDYFCDKV